MKPTRLAILCVLLVLASPALAQERAKKALVIGIDGCRPDAMLAADAPHLHALIKNGAFSAQAQTGDITSSGPGWSSLLTGVWREKHGVRGNDFKGSNYRDFPNLVERLAKARPAARAASVAAWAPIREKIITKAYHTSAPRGDRAVARAAAELLGDESLDLLFVHFDDVDGAGHRNGFSPKQTKYLQAIHEVDVLAGVVLKAMHARKTFDREDWLVVVSTDHGGSGKSHGANNPECRTIFVIVSGPSATRGAIAPAPAIVDVAPTVLRHLGVAIDPAWKLDGRPVGLK